MVWSQVYDPLNNMWLSALVAAIPIVVLLGAIAIFEIRAHIAAALGLVAALLIAIVGFGMPAGMAGATAVYGAAYGLLPIGWIILNVIFLYRLTDEAGLFSVLRDYVRSNFDAAVDALVAEATTDERARAVEYALRIFVEAGQTSASRTAVQARVFVSPSRCSTSTRPASTTRTCGSWAPTTSRATIAIRAAPAATSSTPTTASRSTA